MPRMNIGITMFLVAISGCTAGTSVTHIDIYSLLSNPNEFDGQRIQVQGYLFEEFQGTGIYPSEMEAIYPGSFTVWLT